MQPASTCLLQWLFSSLLQPPFEFRAQKIRAAMRIDASTQGISITKACGKLLILGLHLTLAAHPLEYSSRPKPVRFSLRSAPGRPSLQDQYLLTQ